MAKTRVVLQILATIPRNLIYEFMSYLLLLDFISLGFDLWLFRGLKGNYRFEVSFFISVSFNFAIFKQLF